MQIYLATACLMTLAACASAEAPASAPYPPASGPYPPSGWKPSGQRLVLPARQVSTAYGPPSQGYGPPAQGYGPPTQGYGPPPQAPPQEYGPPTAATEAPATEAAPTEQATDSADEEATPTPGGESEQLRDGGVYYVLLQDGTLQMVRYRTTPLRLQKKPQRSQRQQKAQFTKSAKTQQVQLLQAHQGQFQPAKIQQQPSRVNVQPARFTQQPQPFHFVEIQKSQEIEVAQPPPQQAPNGFAANLKFRNVEPISAPVFAVNSAPLVRILKK